MALVLNPHQPFFINNSLFCCRVTSLLLPPSVSGVRALIKTIMLRISVRTNQYVFCSVFLRGDKPVAAKLSVMQALVTAHVAKRPEQSVV